MPGRSISRDYPGRVRVVIVRHAEAGPGSPDDLRALTPRGHKQARALGRELRAELGVPDAILTSPLLRARETAAGLALGPVEVEPLLAPGAAADDVRHAVDGRGALVVVVGHQPDCGRIVAALTAGPEPPFPPAGWALADLG
jgi:phosphohistidine phosphatase